MMGNPGFVTVETVMVFGLGFLVALLLMLAVMPAVHERAVRLTRRKYDPVPLSEKEMRAAKDRLRADFAISTRKLEQTIEEMQRKVAAQATDLARRAETIAQLKRMLDTRDTLIAQLQGQNTGIIASGTNGGGIWRAFRRDNAAKTALQGANQRIKTLMSEIGTLTAALDRRIHVYDTQQQEIMALTSQNEALRLQLVALAPPLQRLARGFAPAAERAGNGGKAVSLAPNLAPSLAPSDEDDIIRRARKTIESQDRWAQLGPDKARGYRKVLVPVTLA
jgi:hypothetical protein